MKIDRNKLKKSTSDVPSDCRQLIDRLKSFSSNESALLAELKSIKTWNYGKSELYHWIDVLDMFDSILERPVKKDRDTQWSLPCDSLENESLRELLIHVILFTSLLIEHSFSRHLYNSMEYLTTLLSSSDMSVVLAVLNLLYVFSKRSNFISRLNSDRKSALIQRLNYLAESWGGKENGFGLAECCQDLSMSSYPSSATTLHFEFYSDENKEKSDSTTSSTITANAPTATSSSSLPGSSTKSSSKAGATLSSSTSAPPTLTTIHIESVYNIRDRSIAQIMEDLVDVYNVPRSKQMLLFTHLRLAHSFSNYRKRLQCVQARLQALSIIVYCNAMSISDGSNNILYNGFIEELVEVLELKVPSGSGSGVSGSSSNTVNSENVNKLLEIKAAALRTLTSVIHLDHSSKLSVIIDATGASLYHGFLPSLVRSCIQALIDGNTESFPLPFATALFSFLYHLGSYENGGEALVSCGMIESLVKVISWKGTDPEHITFVTRAVRVIDLITNLDMSAFQTHNGLNKFIKRLEYEIDICRHEQPFVIDVPIHERFRDQVDEVIEGENGGRSSASSTAMDVSVNEHNQERPDVSNNESESGVVAPLTEVDVPQQTNGGAPSSGTSGVGTSPTTTSPNNSQTTINKDVQCYPQRAALLKSMLNFLKKAIQDPAFSDNIRHLMDGSLPSTLRHIISNAEYYGPSLFMLATDVVTVYVFQEPSLLSTLQETGLTDVVLQALLTKPIPPTREVISSLPNVFSALCLNSHGLESFRSLKPFDKVFSVLLSNDYLPAMRRRRSSDPMGDTASNLGTSMDELMRHQPSIRSDATTSIINLLNELCRLGTSPNYVCSKSSKYDSTISDGGPSTSSSHRHHHHHPPPGNDGGSSDEDDDDDEDGATNPTPASSTQQETGTQQSSASTNTSVDVVNGVQSNNEQIVGVVDPNKPSTSTGISESPKVPVPLVDYILNVMRFVDAILSNNSTDDHCQEFVKQKGLTPLLRILLLPNLPIDFPTSQACISVASVAKSILTLAHEKEVLREGLKLLNEVLAKLDPIHRSLSEPGGSVLLEELIEATSKANSTGQDPFSSAVLTPLLHAMSAAHAMIVMFVHVSRTGQNDVRNLSVTHWGSEAGIAVLNKLSLLYTSLVWESTILLAMCSSATPSAEPLIDSSWKFGKHQLEKLSALIASKEGKGESGITTASVEGESVMEVDGEQQPLTGSSSSQTVVSKSKSSTSTSTSKSSSSSKLSPHIKQIKPLLTSASRLGRVLAELFGILVKLCVGTPLRHRRHQHMPNLPMPPSPPARAIASALSKLLTNRLSWQPPPTALPIPRFRLTFYICSVGFTSPMLFDERKYPFHLMLQQFVKHGGQKAFFDTFYWAITQGGKVEPTEGIEHPELPDGTGEFLDAWLLLLEKMVNPKTILESPHSLPTTSITGSSSLSSFTPFDPVRYLIRTHKRAFECIMYLWNKKPLKTYGERMSETILTILCHLLKGESIIKEKLAKEKEDSIPTGPATGSGTAANSGTTGPSRQARRTGLRDDPEELGINPDHLQQLMDMGFARPLCIEALSMTNSLEQATDYCLSNPGHVGIPELDMNEEDAMSRAIAISLGEDGSGAVITAALRPTGAAAVGENGQPIVGTSSGATTNFNETEKKEPENEQPPPPALEEEVEDNDPIPKVVIDEFVKDILPGCLKLLDELPETVYRVCDLLIAVATREKSNKSSDDDSGVSVKSESDDWMRHVFRQLIQEISNNISILIKATEPMTSSDKRTILEWASQLTTIPEAMKAATRIHVFSLLFEERRNECASLISETNLIESLVHLLEATQNTMSILLNHLSSESASGSTSTTTSGTTTTQVQTPKWLAPVILLIDLYDKAAIASVRRSPCLYFTRRQWKWFDDRTGKWTSYTSANNKTIDDAYKSGESHVRFVSGRRKYTIQYSNMVQVNEESGSWRPIMFVNDTEKKPEGPSVSGSSTTNKDDNAMEGVTEGTTEGMTASSITSVPSEATSPTIEAKKFRTINGLDLSQCSSLIRSSVGFINIPVDSDTLHAVMRLVLRLTRNYDMAASFAELGGVRAMLSLTQRSAFTGFNSLATLIIRHILEEPLTLRQTMEKVIRSTVHHSPMSFKEMHYILRILAPAACRDTILFSDVIKQTVRIALPALTKREEDDTRLQSPNAVQLLKLLGGSSSAIGPSGAIGSTTTDKTGTTSLTTISRENSSKIIKSLICDLLNALAIKVPTVTPTPPKPSISSTVTTPTDETKDVATSSTSGLPGTAPDGVQNAPPSLDQSSPPIGHPQIAICPPAPVEGNVQVVEDIDEDSSENAEESVDFAVGPFESSSGSAVVGGSSSGTTTIKFTIPIFGSKEEMDARRNRPLLTQSSLLRLLAELSKSYPIVAKIIAEYSYTAGQAELITEDCSALAFILDNLLPTTQTIGDKDCPALSRVLIASIASCNHCPEAQSSLVTEVKSSLTRSLTMIESIEKHARIQSLTNVMNTMIESCPTTIPHQNISSSMRHHHPPLGVNNIVKVMLKKGLINDLARVTHSLDLSSPNMATTVNCVMKPLETLSRIVNQPTGPTHNVTHSKKSKTTGESLSSRREEGATETENGTQQQTETGNNNNDATNQSLQNVINSLVENLTVPVNGTTINSGSDEDNSGQRDQSVPLIDLSPIRENVAEGMVEPVDPISDDAIADDLAMVDAALVMAVEEMEDDVDEERSSERRRLADESHDVVVDEDMASERNVGDRHHHHGHDHESSSSSSDGDDSDDDSEGDDDGAEEEEEENSDAEDHADDDDEDEDDHDNEDDEDDDDDDDDDDEEEVEDDESNVTFDEGLEGPIESALIRVPSDRHGHHHVGLGIEEDILLDIDELISPAALRGGIAGLIPMLDDAIRHDLRHEILGGHSSGESSQPIVPPAPGNVTIHHPLLVRHSFQDSLLHSSHAIASAVGGAAASILAGGSRHHRTAGRSRELGSAHRTIQRYMSSHDRSMFGGGHHPWSGAVSAAIRATGGIGGGHQNPPVILQRLLANSSAQDFLQMSSHHHGIGGPSSGNRFILSGNDFQIIATDDFGDYVDFHDPFIPFGGPSSAGASSGSASSAMSSIPNAMSRWTEESRVLDGDSMHDCVSSIKSEIVEFLEKCRDDEINDRKTKRQKMIEEEEKRNREKMEKKSQEKQENKENREQSKTEQVTASEVTSGSGNTEQGATASSENSINSSTEQLAANIVEQVLAPFSVANVDQVVTGSLRSTPIVRTPPLLDVTSPLSPTPVSVSTEQVAERQLVSGQVVEIDEIPPTSSQEQSNSCNNNVVEMMDVNGGSSSEGISSVVIPERPTEENATRVAQSEEQPSTIANESQSSTDNAIEQSNASSNETQPQTNFETTGEATTTTTTGESGSASTTNDPEIPEGVDPSFLAALPENIRQEVIADQLRIQRQNRLAQQARQQQSVTGTTAVAAGSTTEAGAVTGGASSSSTSAGINNLTTPAEISPEFLAALPPNIREEVIAEHTAQERLAQAQQNDPNAAVDPASFIQSLPPGLRRQVLADMDDSQIALLPPDLASEAQALRSELEQRQRQIQERFFSTHGSTLSRILRSAAARGGGTSGGGSRYAIHTIGGSSWPWNIDHRDHHGGSSSNRRMRLGYDGPTGGTAIRSGGIPGSNPLGLPAKFKGKQLLDHEALSCLLILLFVDEPKLNVGRLHRVLRNLSQHPTTRAWIIQSLLAIMDRTRDCRGVTSSSHHEPIPTPQPSLTGKHKKSSVKFSTTPSTTTTSPNQSSSWLSISLDAALGCKMNVFQVQHTVHPVPKGKKSPSSSVVTTPPGQSVTIHPQAAPLVSRHVLDALISLAKSFPSSFVTTISEVMSASVESTEGEKKSEVTTKSPLSSDFWDVLVRLDSSSTSSSGKGKSSKSIVKSSSQVPTNDLDGSVSESGLTLSKSEGTPLKSIIELLSHPVIRRSAQLTDRLLRLLSLIALALHQQQSGQILATSRQISTTSTHTNDSSSTTTTTVTAPATKSDAKVNEPPPENKSETRPFVGEDQLRLAVEVLTTKSCSEEGLEDVNSLLLRLSQSCPKTRDIVLKLLLAGARQLGRTVKQNIDSLFEELRSLNQSSRPPTSADEGTSGSSDKLEKGIVHDRFTKEKVVITAPTMRPGHTGSSTTTVTASTSKEVQLPSMAALTSRTSSQQFFLRILKVIIQLRESIRLQKKKELEQRARLQQISISGQPSSSDVAQPVTSSSSSNAMEIDGPSASTSNTMTTDNQQRETNNSTESNVEKNVDEQSSSNPSSSETTKESEQTKVEEEEESLSSQLSLDDLWNSLSRCLLELADAPDHHAVLVLQPAVESFFLVHATTDKDSLDGHGHRYGSGHGGRSRLREVESRENQLAHINQDIIAPPSPHGPDAQSGTDGGTGPSSLAVSNLPPDTQKFLKFAETHKVVLNQCIRQSTVPLADGPFAVLIDHTRVLDFDVKRRYFRQELERLDDGVRREDLAVHVRREHVFEDSFRELYRRSPDEWKNRFYIVFEGEEGQDAGGLLREWYTIISREIFNPMYALFTTSPGDRVTYMINSASHCNSNHLQYFKFVGRVIAKAIYDNKLLECYFTRSFYKHILGKSVRYQDMESEDYAFYQGLVYLLENDMATSGLDLTFSIEIQEFGVTEIRDLLPNGRNIPVTEDRKHEYVRLVCQEKMTGAIRKQLNAFLEGFYEIIPKRLISIFNEQETELLLSGLPNIDIDDLKSNTEYHKYQPNSLQIQWFWRALRSFDQADRAKFLQFVTGTSKVPLQGFASLEGMNGVQKFQIHRDDRSTDRLPSAHTCFNQLDLPAYETYDKLKSMLLKAVRECSEGFGFA